jgi:hypothetical protein
VLTLLISCNISQDKQLTKKRTEDSLAQVIQLEKEKAIADSIDHALRKEKALIAFGRIKFGMKRDTVKAIIEKTFQPGAVKTLRAYKYTFTPFYNKSGQLYMLRLQTLPESYMQLESTVMARVQNLKQIIVAKYGEPQKSFEYPTDSAFLESDLQWTNIWAFDTKTIKIGVEAEPEESKFKAVCWIYDDPVRVSKLSKQKDLQNANAERVNEGF